jgi:hypothetical protein
VSLSTFVVAQSDAVRAIYDRSAIVPTNIPGIHTFPAPPAGYNPVTASDTENATYGFPPRPDKQTDAASYAKWARAMSTAGSATRWYGQLKETGLYSKPARPAPAPPGAAAVSATGPTPGYYYNWSGFINTNTAKKYKQSTSFYYIVSDFNVPAVKQSPGTCDGGWDLEVSWNGIDGNQDGSALLQGGTLSGAYCSGTTTATDYYAWIEWWPAYSILSEFNVNPGDDLFVETWDTSATTGYVYLYDETLNVVGDYGITSNGGPGLIGNSAEYIVERPCCREFNGNYYDYPLPNYVWDFWANSYAYNYTDFDKGIVTPYYPGSTSTANILAIMVNDQNNSYISVPEAQGKYGIFFEAGGCTTASSGCTP